MDANEYQKLCKTMEGMEEEAIREMKDAKSENNYVAWKYNQFGVWELAFQMGWISLTELQEKERKLHEILPDREILHIADENIEEINNEDELMEVEQ